MLIYIQNTQKKSIYIYEQYYYYSQFFLFLSKQMIITKNQKTSITSNSNQYARQKSKNKQSYYKCSFSIQELWFKITVLDHQCNYAIESIIQNKKLMLSEGIPWGKFVSFLMFCSLFTVLPMLMKPIFAAVEGYHWFLIYVFTVIVCGMGTQLIFNIIMYFVYRAKHPWLQQYRIHNKPWPWQQSPQKWPKLLKKTLRSVLMNGLIYAAILVFLTDVILFHIPYKTSVSEWPAPSTMLFQFTVIIVMEDLLSYHMHRLFHTKGLYWIHKQHHEYYTTIALATTYTHPLDVMFSNTMPLYAGYRLLTFFMDVHVVMIGVWFIFRLWETCEIHCGYNWSWAQLSFLPGKNPPQHHDFHHSMNVGSYSSMFCFWDWVMDTRDQYDKYLSKKKK